MSSKEFPANFVFKLRPQKGASTSQSITPRHSILLAAFTNIPYNQKITIMKVKIVSIPSAEDYPKICFQDILFTPTLGQAFWNSRCYPFCMMGVLNTTANWHTPPLSESEKKAVSLHSINTWDYGDFRFGPIEGVSQTITHIWNLGETIPAFKDCFNSEENGGYLMAIKRDDGIAISGHTLALKWRDRKWRFMDPTTHTLPEGKTGYFYSDLSHEGTMVTGKNSVISPLDYVFGMYGSQVPILQLAIIRIRPL